jgi:iron(III) transport system substrate-binding protein
MNRLCRCLLAAGLLASAACGGSADRESAEVNVYSHRHYEADQQLFDRFTEQTGIRVNVVTASADELITRLENEGAASPADVLITVDAGRLHRAKVRGLLQPVESAVLNANVPEHLRDRDRQWWGLTQRARVIAYHKARVDPAELSTYEALTEPRWQGRILVRSSDNVYNQSMLAALIAHLGEDAAEAWARGVVANMARPPSGGDTDQVKAVAAGVGDIAIANTYYIARLAESADAEERRIAEQIGVFFPNQDDRGAHVNVSGAGITRHAGNVDHARALLEFLTGAEAQAVFAESNQEYPVNPAVAWSRTLQGWGQFQADTLDLTRLGELNDTAVRIFDRAGWR